MILLVFLLSCTNFTFSINYKNDEKVEKLKNELKEGKDISEYYYEYRDGHYPLYKDLNIMLQNKKNFKELISCIKTEYFGRRDSSGNSLIYKIAEHDAKRGTDYAKLVIDSGYLDTTDILENGFPVYHEIVRGYNQGNHDKSKDMAHISVQYHNAKEENLLPLILKLRINIVKRLEEIKGQNELSEQEEKEKVQLIKKLQKLKTESMRYKYMLPIIRDKLQRAEIDLSMITFKGYENLLYNSVFEDDEYIFARLIEKTNFSNAVTRSLDIPIKISTMNFAAKVGSINIIAFLWEDEKIKEYIDKNSVELLAISSSKGHKNICEFLLDRGIKVNSLFYDDRYNALMLAAEEGHREVCELLIGKGVNINYENEYCETALSLAVRENQVEVCDLLLKKGAKVEVEEDGETPSLLSVASERGYLTICKLLIEEGRADVNKKSGRHYIAPLLFAAKNGHKNVCELLIEKGADVDCVGAGMTPLLHAALSGHKEIFNLLLTKDADLSIKDNRYGTTLLMCASMSGSYDMCKNLIERRADVNATDNNKRTALILAAKNGHKNVCELLIEKGADVSAKDNNGNTSLMEAAISGNKEVFDLLISKGAAIDIKNNYNFTLLMSAVCGENKEIIKFFIDKGVDLDERNLDHKRAIDIAKQKNREDIVTLLEKKEAPEAKKAKRM